MQAIVLEKSSFERANSLLRSETYPSTPSFTVSVWFDSVYFQYDSLFDLSLAINTLYFAGIPHRVSIM